MLQDDVNVYFYLMKGKLFPIPDSVLLKVLLCVLCLFIELLPSTSFPVGQVECGGSACVYLLTKCIDLFVLAGEILQSFSVSSE